MEALRVEAMPALPRLVLSDGAVEALKWLALVLMVGDHTNKYLLAGAHDWLFAGGRLCLPLFVFSLAYNLARPGTLERGVYGRAMLRLAIFGAAASVPFIALGGLIAGWWPLNVMFTLLAITATLYLVERGNMVAAGLVLVLGGGVVEFWWPAVVLGVAIWSYCKRPSWLAVLVAVLALTSLSVVNHTLWALAALPLLMVAARLDLHMPRLRWVFYAFYPLHLLAIWLIRIPMREAGYLFL